MNAYLKESLVQSALGIVTELFLVWVMFNYQLSPIFAMGFTVIFVLNTIFMFSEISEAIQYYFKPMGFNPYKKEDE